MGQNRKLLFLVVLWIILSCGNGIDAMIEKTPNRQKSGKNG
jgi:hypothetical protein